MKSKNKTTIKPSNNLKGINEYSVNFLVGITSGIIVLFLGETSSYIDKRDFLSFLIRLVLLLVLLHISFYLGLKVIEKINSEISKEEATK